MPGVRPDAVHAGVGLCRSSGEREREEEKRNRESEREKEKRDKETAKERES